MNELAELYALIAQSGPQPNPVEAVFGWNTDAMASYTEWTITEYAHKDKFRSRFSYAVPTKEAIYKIISFANGGTILEVGAGRGLWAHLINLTTGAKTCIPTDSCANEFNEFIAVKGGTNWCGITVIPGLDAVKSNRGANVLMSIWPYMDEWSGEALVEFQGNKFIFVGEHEGGCTGGDNMFEELDKNWELIESVGIPQWDDMHDEMWLYERKSKKGAINA